MCCLAPTPYVAERVGGEHTIAFHHRSRTVRSYVVKVPLCPDCSQTPTRLFQARAWSAFLPALFVLIVFGRSSAATDGNMFAVALAIAGAIATAMWIGVGFLPWFRRTGHVLHCHAVDVKRGGHLVVHNRGYASVARRG